METPLEIIGSSESHALAHCRLLGRLGMLNWLLNLAGAADRARWMGHGAETMSGS